MSSPSNRRPRPPERRWPHLLSTLLFVAAIVFAGAAVFLYLNEEDTPSEPERPVAEPGRNGLANVVDRLKDAGLHVQLGRYTAETSQLTQPGQTIEVEDHNLFVFIYPDPAEREVDSGDLNPDTLELASRSAERPLNEGEDVHIFQGSNLVAILVGGDGELVSTVEGVITSLP